MPKAGGFAAAKLKGFVQRIETLEEEKAEIADRITNVFGELKAEGFDPATVRAVIRLRKKDKAEREEQMALLDLYLHALGMIPEQEMSPTALELAAGMKEPSGKPGKGKSKGGDGEVPPPAAA